MTALRRISMTQWILIAMVIGVLLGWIFPEAERAANGFAATDLKFLSTIFLRLIKALIVPLLFATLVVGIAGHGNELRLVGRLAVRAMILFTVMTAIALAIGWAAGLLVRPGDGISLAGAAAETGAQLATSRLTFTGVLETAFPQSFAEAAAGNHVLQVLVFSILFGVATTQVPDAARRTIVAFAEALAEVMFKFTALVMAYAPIGIGAAIAVTVSRSGVGILATLGLLVLTCIGALAAFVLLALVPLALSARIPLREFLATIREPLLIAFTAASSDAALPRALQKLEEFGVPRRVAAFAMPTALSFNLTGSTLFVGLATLFVAQAARVPLDAGQQLAIMATLMLTTKGIAAVPRASLVVLAATLSQFGLPLEGVAVILAVDALMDMARTGVNMLSHCIETVVLARWEGAEVGEMEPVPGSS